MARPRIYQNPDDLEKAVDQYIEHCTETEKKPSVTGATMFLGFADKTTLYDYMGREGFTHSIKRVLTFIENAHEENLFGNSVAGSIFALKNMGWTDRQEIAHEGGSININVVKTYGDDKTDKETDASD